MKRDYGVYMMGVLASLLIAVGCGGGGEEGGAESEGAGETSLATLSSIPTMDLSEYDFSASAASTSISVPNKSISVSKTIGENIGAVGMPSRAGCEANMHKKEAIRMSQEAQLDRCYFEAMEKGGLITIPVGSYNYYKITLPEAPPEELQQKCGDIKEDDMKEACEGGEGPKGGNMIARVGRFAEGGELRIDMCMGDEGSESKVNEATYTLSGSTYTGTVIRKGIWGGEDENMKFSISVIADAVTDGIADLGSAGTAKAQGWFHGGFGDGVITFEADASDLSNTVYGAFSASFNDPMNPDVANNFAGKTYAKFGGVSNTGTAQFSFNGTFPAMSLQEMVGGSDDPFGPQGIPAGEQREGFYDAMETELELETGTLSDFTVGNYSVCPNNDFDPNDPNSKGMARTTEDTCSHDKNGIESFSITNLTNAGDMYSSIEQVFVIILHSASAFYDAVSLVNLDDFSSDPGTIDFTRTDWTCSEPADGWTLEIIPEEMMEGNLPSGVTVDPDAMEAAMQTCISLEEKLRENMGMGGYDCADEEMAGGAGKDFGGGMPVGIEEGDDMGGMIPQPCVDNKFTPDECKDYCDANLVECFEDGEGPPPSDQVTQACIDAGIEATDFIACGEYCQSHQCF